MADAVIRMCEAGDVHGLWDFLQPKGDDFHAFVARVEQKILWGDNCILVATI